jgi:hypothetical protein
MTGMNSKQDPNEPVSQGMLNEAVDAILEGMGRMVEGLENKMNSRFDKVENRLQGVETEVRYVVCLQNIWDREGNLLRCSFPVCKIILRTVVSSATAFAAWFVS